MRALVSFVVGIVLGMGLGYAAALLFAPQEGDVTRRRLLAEAEDWPTAPQRALDAAMMRLDEAGRAARLAAGRKQAELEAQANLRRAGEEGRGTPV